MASYPYTPNNNNPMPPIEVGEGRIGTGQPQGVAAVTPAGTVASPLATASFGPQLAQMLQAYPGALQAASDRQQKAYDEMEGVTKGYLGTLSQPNKNDQWGRFGAGLLAPTRTGSFFEGFGNAANAAMDAREQYRTKEQQRQEKLYHAQLGLSELAANRPDPQLARMDNTLKAYKVNNEVGGYIADDALANGLTPQNPQELLADYQKNPRKYMGARGQAMVEEAKQSLASASEREFELQKIMLQNSLKTPTRSPGQQAVDKRFGAEVADWYAMGGDADSQKQIAQLRSVRTRLGGDKNLSGWFTGNMPDWFNSIANPEALDTRDLVGEVVQRNLRTILGAQFTQKEGDALIDRAYNPKLDEATNKKRVNALIMQMEEAYKTKTEAIEYFEQNGTLEGFNKRIPTYSDFESAIENADAIDAASTASKDLGFDVNTLPPDVKSWVKEQLEGGADEQQVIEYLRENYGQGNGE